jgi:23S rRNA pseudouridine955/2504/2580 synthase
MYRDVPLGAIMGAIRRGEVRVNGAKGRCDRRLAAGEEVHVPWSLPGAARAVSAGHCEGTAERLRTLLRNDDVWIVDKPAGVLSQPDRSTGDSVITRAWSELSWERVDFRPALIHRLDRNVSGVMAIAMNSPTLRLLSGLMRESLVRKIYRAIVRGVPPEMGEVDGPILKDGSSNTVAVDDAGRRALTRYRRISSDGRRALVELELVTGRPHQARAHMSSIGHPILGDAKYGGDAARRLFLHARSLEFPNLPDMPPTLAGVLVRSEMPGEFVNVLACS